MPSKAQDSTATLRPQHARTLRDFDTLPDSAEVRAPVVAAWRGVSVATIWRWSTDGSGTLPAPTRTGGVTSWSVGKLRRAQAK
jgi:prophage regulatory protein